MTFSSEVCVCESIMFRAPGKQSGTRILLDAMSKDQVHLARFVLDALDGQIVDSQTESAQTPLISSILLPDGKTRCKFVELLLRRGATVNCRDGAGRTALSYACENGYLDAVKVLVRNNADPEVVDAWGNTALMYAAVAGHSPVVEFLVRAFKRLGLQIDRQNKVGNSAAEVAKFLGHTECVSALNRKGREAEGAPGKVGDSFEREVGQLVEELELIHTCSPVGSLSGRCGTGLPRPRVKQSRLPSMDSIDEFDRENDGSSSPPRELLFSGVLTPQPPLRTEHSLNSKPPQTRGRLASSDDHLPLLHQSSETQRSVFFSPRPVRNTPAPTALDILLTPIQVKKNEEESAALKSKMLDFGGRRCHDSYYQKRSSLPTSALSRAPPERTLVPLRKSRTVRRRAASPSRAEPLQLPTPPASTSTTSLSVFSNKLLRRFTSPEIKTDVKEVEQVPKKGRIPRSETFPQSFKHPQVGSKPSIDSISSVQCEFDFQFRMQNS